MRYLLFFVVALFTVFVSDGAVFAAQGDCYGFSFSDRQTTLSTYSKLAQQWTPSQDISVTGVAFNIYGDPGDDGLFFMEVQGTSAGLPDGSIVSGTSVNKDADTVPGGVEGAGRAFVCSAIPDIQRFDFASPVSFTGGVMYALIIYHTLPGGAPVGVSWVTYAPTTAPLSGLRCTGSPCVGNTGWEITDFDGENYDTVYSIYDEFVDPFGTGDKKIDDHIIELRNYLKLGGVGGGLIFGLGIMAIIFALGIKFEIPFAIIALFNTLLLGTLSRAGIVPQWILLVIIAIAGFALVFKLASSGGNSDA